MGIRPRRWARISSGMIDVLFITYAFSMAMVGSCGVPATTQTHMAYYFPGRAYPATCGHPAHFGDEDPADGVGQRRIDADHVKLEILVRDLRPRHEPESLRPDEHDSLTGIGPSGQRRQRPHQQDRSALPTRLKSATTSSVGGSSSGVSWMWSSNSSTSRRSWRRCPDSACSAGCSAAGAAAAAAFFLAIAKKRPASAQPTNLGFQRLQQHFQHIQQHLQQRLRQRVMGCPRRLAGASSVTVRRRRRAARRRSGHVPRPRGRSVRIVSECLCWRGAGLQGKACLACETNWKGSTQSHDTAHVFIYADLVPDMRNNRNAVAPESLLGEAIAVHLPMMFQIQDMFTECYLMQKMTRS